MVILNNTFNPLTAVYDSSISYQELLRNYCSQFSTLYITLAIFIFIGVLLKSYLTPIAFETFKGMLPVSMNTYKEMLDLIEKRLVSFFDTALLMGVSFLLIFTIHSNGIENLSLGHKIGIGFILIIIFLVIFQGLIEFLKRKFKK